MTDLKWSADSLFGGQFFRNNDGSVDLVAKDLKQDATTCTPLEIQAGKDFCFLLRGATHRAGVYFRAQGARRGLDLIAQRHRTKGLVIVPWLADDNAREVAFKDGLSVGDTFWVRLRVGFDQIELSASADGQHWRTIQSQDFDPEAPDAVFRPQAASRP